MAPKSKNKQSPLSNKINAKTNAAKTNAKANDPNFYRLPNPFLGGTIFFLLGFLYVIVAAPNSIPECVWPLAQIGNYLTSKYYNFLLKWTYMVLVVHVGQALYAAKVCFDRKYTPTATLKWVISVFAVGFPSMMVLLPGQEEDKKSR